MIVDILTAMVMFARRVAHLDTVERDCPSSDPADGTVDDAAAAKVVYWVRGELFFASSNDLVYQFDYVDDPHHVVIDMSESHFWDAYTVAALDAITTKYQRKGKHVEIVGLK